MSIKSNDISKGMKFVEIRGASELKNVTKRGKSLKWGGWSAPEIKKSTIQNLDFLIRGGGEGKVAIYSFFS